MELWNGNLLRIEITGSNDIFVFDIDEHENFTGEKYAVEEDLDILETIMNAVTSKMMEIINKNKK